MDLSQTHCTTLAKMWREGNGEAAGEIHRRFAKRLRRLVEPVIRRGFQRRFDADDVVQTALRTFFCRVRDGRLTIHNTVSLWALLVKIAKNKLSRRMAHHVAERRDVRREAADALTTAGEFTIDDGVYQEAVVMFYDQLEEATAGFTQRDREILELVHQGYSMAEIQRRIGCSRWTVRRVLNKIAERLRQDDEVGQVGE